MAVKEQTFELFQKAAKLPAYRFDPRTGRYHNLNTGRMLAFSEIYGVLNTKEEIDSQKLLDLARAFQKGDIPAGVWHQATMNMLRRLHVQFAAVGAGGFNRIRPSTFIRIDNNLRDDADRLVRFGEQIPSMSDGQLRYRVNLYVGHARAIYERARPEPRLKDPVNWMTVERRVLLTGDNCEWCIHLADQGWQPHGLLPYPGEVDDAWYGHACLTNCRCQVQRRYIKRKNADKYIAQIYQPRGPDPKTKSLAVKAKLYKERTTFRESQLRHSEGALGGLGGQWKDENKVPKPTAQERLDAVEVERRTAIRTAIEAREELTQPQSESSTVVRGSNFANTTDNPLQRAAIAEAEKQREFDNKAVKDITGMDEAEFNALTAEEFQTSIDFDSEEVRNNPFVDPASMIRSKAHFPTHNTPETVTPLKLTHPDTVVWSYVDQELAGNYDTLFAKFEVKEEAALESLTEAREQLAESSHKLNEVAHKLDYIEGAAEGEFTKADYDAASAAVKQEREAISPLFESVRKQEETYKELVTDTIWRQSVGTLGLKKADKTDEFTMRLSGAVNPSNPTLFEKMALERIPEDMENLEYMIQNSVHKDNLPMLAGQAPDSDALRDAIQKLPMEEVAQWEYDEITGLPTNASPEIMALYGEGAKPGIEVSLNRADIRSSANSWGVQISLPGYRWETAMHESAHVIEDNNNDVALYGDMFRRYRSKNDPVRAMSEVVSAGYNPDEITQADKWEDSYSGKIYTDTQNQGAKIRDFQNGTADATLWYAQPHGSEILSMGMQKFHKDPYKFWSDDPEYFLFTASVMSGRFRDELDDSHMAYRTNPYILEKDYEDYY